MAEEIDATEEIEAHSESGLDSSIEEPGLDEEDAEKLPASLTEEEKEILLANLKARLALEKERRELKRKHRKEEIKVMKVLSRSVLQLKDEVSLLHSNVDVVYGRLRDIEAEGLDTWNEL